MQQNLPHKLEKRITLPVVNLLDRTELAFSHAFLHAARTLHSYLQEIQSSIALVVNSDEPCTVAVVGLFSKLVCSYNSYVLLETHYDNAGSQFLVEELWNTAVTLTYLLEVADRETFTDYIAASVYQARVLLQEVETQLLQLPQNLELLVLRDRLKALLIEQKQPVTDRSLANPVADKWGIETANTTAKRAALLGLSFLSNPAQQIVQKITPASWLDVQLNYINSATHGSRASNSQEIDFQQLRDASHLCLHVTKALLEEFIQRSNASQVEIQQQLNEFFEWFYQAYQAYSSDRDASLKSHKNGGRR